MSPFILVILLLLGAAYWRFLFSVLAAIVILLVVLGVVYLMQGLPPGATPGPQFGFGSMPR